MKDEQRRTARQITIDNDVRALIELSGGTVREGYVADSSLGGARISASTEDLAVGDRVRLVFLFPSCEKVADECEIRHVDAEGRTFGVAFTSDPEPVKVHGARRSINGLDDT